MDFTLCVLKDIKLIPLGMNPRTLQPIFEIYSKIYDFKWNLVCLTYSIEYHSFILRRTLYEQFQAQQTNCKLNLNEI